MNAYYGFPKYNYELTKAMWDDGFYYITDLRMDYYTDWCCKYQEYINYDSTCP